jgi:hypothetical protein
MNDRLPYEKQLAQQWNDLPLPDENMAWADMKRRLDKDDDDGIIPFWLRGCGLWGLLSLILIALGWWIVRPDKWWNKTNSTAKTETINQKDTSNNIDKKTLSPGDTLQLINETRKERPAVNTDTTLKDQPSDIISEKSKQQQKNISQKKDDAISVDITNGQAKKKKTKTVKIAESKSKPTKTQQNKKQPAKKINGKEDEIAIISIEPGGKDQKPRADQVEPTSKPVITGKDSLAITSTNVNKTDTAKKVVPDSTQKKDAEETAKDDKKGKKSRITFGAGIAMQQLIPVEGQKLTPYSSTGRKGSIADYIPSVYFRVYKDDKWFLQTEFKYGAPQYNKEFLYENSTKEDIVGLDTTRTFTSSSLKKTFYHQLPITLHYFITPDWSIGTGIIWNKFVNAVSLRDQTTRLNSGPLDTLLLGAIVQDRNTSVFSKSYLHAVFETQYRWRRFSFGARYAFGLQPYIRFTLANGTEQEEKNKSLNIFVRYELWKSKKKK